MIHKIFAREEKVEQKKSFTYYEFLTYLPQYSSAELSKRNILQELIPVKSFLMSIHCEKN